VRVTSSIGMSSDCFLAARSWSFNLGDMGSLVSKGSTDATGATGLRETTDAPIRATGFAETEQRREGTPEFARDLFMALLTPCAWRFQSV